MCTRDDGLIIHLLGGVVGAMGLVLHSYRRGACGCRAERWLTTANVNWTIRDVNCKRCMRTVAYREAMDGKTG